MVIKAMSKNNGLIFHDNVIAFVVNAWLKFDEYYFSTKKRSMYENTFFIFTINCDGDVIAK